jgi:hypothetical protein
MTAEQRLIETWRQLPEHRQQEVIDFAQSLAERRQSESSPTESPPAVSELGKKIQSIRDRIVASGIPLLTPEEVEKEVLERRGGIRSNELPEEATEEVIVQIDTPKPKSAKSKGLSRFIGATKGKGSFSSVAEVDEYIRQERDSWD